MCSRYAHIRAKIRAVSFYMTFFGHFEFVSVHAEVFINNLGVEHSLQSNFSTFPMCFKGGSSTVPVSFPMVCG